MAETYKLQVTLDIEVEKSGITETEPETIEFVQQSLLEVAAKFYEQDKDPKYLGPKMRVMPIDYNSIKVVE